jgi:hypothetical protein
MPAKRWRTVFHSVPFCFPSLALAAGHAGHRVDTGPETADTGNLRWAFRTPAMHPPHLFVPYGLITFGAIYIAKPDIFYIWMSRRDTDGQRKRMPEPNKVFMRGLGLVLIVVGMVLLMRST